MDEKNKIKYLELSKMTYAFAKRLGPMVQLSKTDIKNTKLENARIYNRHRISSYLNSPISQNQRNTIMPAPNPKPQKNNKHNPKHPPP
jgi:hypothetical protein